ncbi:hypothetical protein WAI453_005229 [Rhynchosporium graminicola]
MSRNPRDLKVQYETDCLPFTHSLLWPSLNNWKSPLNLDTYLGMGRTNGEINDEDMATDLNEPGATVYVTVAEHSWPGIFEVCGSSMIL